MVGGWASCSLMGLSFPELGTCFVFRHAEEWLSGFERIGVSMLPTTPLLLG